MTRHLVSTNGVELSVLDEGHGPAVLFCHGFPALAASWHAQVAAVARAGYRAIAPDMRGYGSSTAPDDPAAYTPFHTVGDLVGLLDALDLADAVIVGHDFGANVAWNAAMMRRDRFRAVFGLSVAFRRPGGTNFLDQFRAAGRDDFYMFAMMAPDAARRWEPVHDAIPAFYHRSSGQASARDRWQPFDADAMTRPVAAGAGAGSSRAIDPGYLQEAITVFNRTGLAAPLNYYRSIDPFFALASGAFAGATIAQPSAFMVGSAEGLLDFIPDERGMRENLRDLRAYVMLDGIGHWPQLEAPDAVNAALLSFLAEIDGIVTP